MNSRIYTLNRHAAVAGPSLIVLALWLGASQTALGQVEFLGVQRLTNQEVQLRLSAPTGYYRLEAATTLPDWQGFLTLRSTGVSVHADSAAPYLNQRFFRAQQVTGTNVVTGDHLPTPQGDIIFHPVDHASLVLTWNGKTIYNDPVGSSSLYAGLPKADLILVSHSHGDHFSGSTIDAVRGSNCVIVAPSAVYSSLSTTLKGLTVVLTNGASTEAVGGTVDAIPAYNSNHPLGSGNGYVLTLGGKRIYFAGDTGNIPEMRALRDIDVAFLCINIPYTMTPSDATNAVWAFRPKVVYPYHYRDQSGATTNAAAFKQRLGTAAGVEVRLRKWY
jgi:L-ascorbate metabolism protein UlaG (beta-lactamase superfamily)